MVARLARGGFAPAPARRPPRLVDAAMHKKQAKKTGAKWPRSNNDKRRMVTRRQRQPRTVKRDSGLRGEFEKIFESLSAR
jgi:hypothetical protein